MSSDGTDDPGRTSDAATPSSISTIVHDLNNALAAIGAFSHLIRTDPSLPDGLRRQAELLLAEADRARAIAEELVAAGSPAARSVAAGADPATLPAVAGGGSARVLVVDDEASIREFLARVLTRAGLIPVLASSGNEALAVVQVDPPDAILCDHRMAGMSGPQLHAQVVKVAPDLATRFAFMSGDVLDRDLRAMATSGAIPVLAKPFDIATVGAMVERLLDGLREPEASEAQPLG